MSENREFAIGGVTFNAASGELSAPAAARRLEPRAAAVLGILCTRRGEVVSRQGLLDRCWGEGEGSDEALTQSVAQIRRAFQELGENDVIETLAKRGYRLKRQSIAAARPSGVQFDWPRFAIPAAAVVVGATLILALAFPHGVRHSVRHMLGLGPPAAAAPGH